MRVLVRMCVCVSCVVIPIGLEREREREREREYIQMGRSGDEYMCARGNSRIHSAMVTLSCSAVLRVT